MSSDAHAATRRPFQVMAKPVGPRCNLDCAYCYYLRKEALYPDTRDFRMSDDVLERFIRDHIAAQAEAGLDEISFMWQGGEPTLLGTDFFARVVALQNRHARAGLTVRNSVQTNGTLIDAGWAGFLRDNDFLVGLSLDGPAAHDRYRRDRRGRESFARAEQALETLLAHDVAVNVLSVVHSGNAARPRELYRYLRATGATVFQFIPAVERIGGTDASPRLAPWSVSARAFGAFLCAMFDEWVTADVGRVFIQLFDVQLGIRLGEPSGLCVFGEDCSGCLALEHNGDLYACDHFVDTDHLRGNIMQAPIADLARQESQRRFGAAKRALPAVCRACRHLFACQGGCPKDRFIRSPDGEPGLNYFCVGYRRFFDHAEADLAAMAELVRRGLPASRVMESARARRDGPGHGKVGRNAPCPCGSGRKAKHCCGAGARAAAPARTSGRPAL